MQSRLRPSALGRSRFLGFPARPLTALDAEAARIVAEDESNRAHGGRSLHIVGSGGVLSGFVRDAHTTVRFAGGAVAVTTHD